MTLTKFTELPLHYPIENVIALIAALGLGGILGALLNSYLEKRKQTQEHDKRIFQESIAILTEQKLLEIANVGLIPQ